MVFAFCRFGNFSEGFYFCRFSHEASLLTVDSEIFARVLFSRNGENALSFVSMAKSCPSHEFLMSQICLLMLFAKIKFSPKFPNDSTYISYCMMYKQSKVNYLVGNCSVLSQG